MKTILITGVSSGLGLAIADEALARGHRVVGTLRREEQRAAFEAKAPGRSVGRLLDVTDTGSIAPLVGAVEEAFGIDVLINNAGYGLRGFTEELDLDALRRQFEVNLFGPVALIQAVLPGMRRRRAGHVVNMASMGGMVTFPGLGAYHGTKFALLGMGDPLAKEVAPLGIKVTSVLPGVYRSDWRWREARRRSRRCEVDDLRPRLGRLRSPRARRVGRGRDGRSAGATAGRADRDQDGAPHDRPLVSRDRPVGQAFPSGWGRLTSLRRRHVSVRAWRASRLRSNASKASSRVLLRPSAAETRAADGWTSGRQGRHRVDQCFSLDIGRLRNEQKNGGTERERPQLSFAGHRVDRTAASESIAISTESPGWVDSGW